MNRSLSELFLLRETPLLLGGLIAALVWVTGSLFSRANEAPTLEHTERWVTAPELADELKPTGALLRGCHGAPPLTGKEPLLLVKLHNLSPGTRLDSLMLTFNLLDNTNMLASTDHAVPPGMASAKGPSCDMSGAEVGPISLQPSGIFQVAFALDGMSLPSLKAETEKSTFKISSPSLATWVQKHYSAVGIIAAALLVTAVLTYIYRLSQLKNRSGNWRDS